ncbi:hypothetical protein Tco_0571690 [Tanacetum coccineum]
MYSSADVLASMVHHRFTTAVDKYLRTKLDDALLKVLERHTADLIKKYYVLPGPELSTDKLILKQFDLKECSLLTHE